MRNPMERLVVLPFSFGCASHSSVQLGAPKKVPKEDDDSKGTMMVPRRQEGEDRSIIKGKMKRSNNKGSSSSSSGFLVLPAAGIQRLIRGIKSLSQLLFYKEENEHEMEIGYPTDVKHVTHIGLDGSTTTNPNINNNISMNNNSASEFLCLSPISIKQFELAMNAQAKQQQQPFINHHNFSICD